MISLIITVLWILIAICLLVGLYYVVIWVFGQLGIPIPPMAIKVGLMVIGLLILIWLISALAGSGGGIGFPLAGRRF